MLNAAQKHDDLTHHEQLSVKEFSKLCIIFKIVKQLQTRSTDRSEIINLVANYHLAYDDNIFMLALEA